MIPSIFTEKAVNLGDIDNDESELKTCFLGEKVKLDSLSGSFLVFKHSVILQELILPPSTLYHMTATYLFQVSVPCTPRRAQPRCTW